MEEELRAAEAEYARARATQKRYSIDVLCAEQRVKRARAAFLAEESDSDEEPPVEEAPQEEPRACALREGWERFFCERMPRKLHAPAPLAEDALGEVRAALERSVALRESREEAGERLVALWHRVEGVPWTRKRIMWVGTRAIEHVLAMK